MKTGLETIQIRVKVAFGMWNVGDIVELMPGYARQQIERGWAEPVEGGVGVVETASLVQGERGAPVVRAKRSRVES